MSILRYLVEELSRDIGIHYGDLGKGLDTYLGRMYAGGGNRGTGHFGTGVYFLSSEATSVMLHKRDSYEIDFGLYKLLKIKTSQDGFMLHDGLKNLNNAVNNIIDKDFDDTWEDKMWANIDKGLNRLSTVNKSFTHLSPNKIALMAKDKAVIFIRDNISSKDNTLSTEVIKMIGYNGVDVRGIAELDNSIYGSVIYNLEDTITI